MKEFLYGRNPVYEALAAGRRDFFQFYVHDGIKEDDRIRRILRLCKEKKVPVRRVPKPEAFANGELA